MTAASEDGGRRREEQVFYSARDRRTLEYGVVEAALERPVTIRLDSDAAETEEGQVVALALVEMIMRVHRHVRIEAPHTPLHHSSGAWVDDRLRHVATQIDPWQDTERALQPDDIVLHVAGAAARYRGSADVVVRWWGGRGEVQIRSLRAGQPPHLRQGSAPVSHLMGACTAAILGAAALLRLTTDQAPRPSAVNLLERTEGRRAGALTVVGPVDVGNVQVVGAGAVTHGLAFWSGIFGHRGNWDFIDADLAELHNTNRCLGMTVEDTGWPQGVRVGEPRSKAESAARQVNGTPVICWFDELPEERQRRDLVLVLANERAVRRGVAVLGETLLLHATTSSNWTSELHRHLLGADDCPACRLPDKNVSSFTCSTGSAVPELSSSTDAALPFLSAGAGLMLVVALLDLAGDQRVLSGRRNHWRLHLELGPRLWQGLTHAGGRCEHGLPRAAVEAVHRADPRRWDHLRHAST